MKKICYDYKMMGQAALQIIYSKDRSKIVQVEHIEAVTTDPGSLTDFPAWARTSGNEILKSEQNGNEITFLIQRKR